MYNEEKNILNWVYYGSKGRTKISCASTTSPQSKELTRGPPQLGSALSFIGGVHNGERALHILNSYGLVKIARLSQWGGGG
jgi:hypothetical protein